MPRLLRQIGFATVRHKKNPKQKAFQSKANRQLSDSPSGIGPRSCTLRSKLNMSGSCTVEGRPGAGTCTVGQTWGPVQRKRSGPYTGIPTLSLPVDRQTE